MRCQLVFCLVAVSLNLATVQAMFAMDSPFNFWNTTLGRNCNNFTFCVDPRIFDIFTNLTHFSHGPSVTEPSTTGNSQETSNDEYSRTFLYYEPFNTTSHLDLPSAKEYLMEILRNHNLTKQEENIFLALPDRLIYWFVLLSKAFKINEFGNF